MDDIDLESPTLADILAAIEPGGTLWWGYEYVPFVSASTGKWWRIWDDDDDVALTVGTLEASFQIFVDTSMVDPDGICLVAQDRLQHEPSISPDDMMEAIYLWSGPHGSPELVDYAHQTFGTYTTSACSEVLLRRFLSELVIAMGRPDIRLGEDFDHDWHTHPLADVFERVEEIDTRREAGEDDGLRTWTLLPAAKEGSDRTLKVTDEVFDFLAHLEMLHTARFDAMDPGERAEAERLEAWLDWTDGTFDPDGLRF